MIPSLELHEKSCAPIALRGSGNRRLKELLHSSVLKVLSPDQQQHLLGAG